MIDQAALSELNRDNIAGAALLAEAALRLQRVHLAGGHRVPEEDPRVRLRNHGGNAGCAQCDGRVLAGGAAAEVGAADDDGVLSLGLAGVNEARGVGGGEADEGVGAELLVLVGLGRNEGEVFRGDDLVRVDVVADDVAEAVEGGGGRGRRAGLCAWGLKRNRSEIARV